MSGADALLVAHILLVVYWLGTDVGVFYSSFVVRRRGLSTETRVVVRRLMRTLDMAPRLALILMIPVALALGFTRRLAFADADRGTTAVMLWLLALVVIGWAAASVWAFRRSLEGDASSGPVRAFNRFDWGARAAASVFFLVTGAWSLVADGGPYPVNWVAWKALLFGVVIATGLWIRLAARGYLPALADVFDHGEEGGRLERLDRAIRPVYPPVLVVWALVLTITVIAVVKPA